VLSPHCPKEYVLINGAAQPAVVHVDHEDVEQLAFQWLFTQPEIEEQVTVDTSEISEDKHDAPV
jgi:hypothetical protein